jgi:glycosyltransferase involved in cell wall biosynthesis
VTIPKIAACLIVKNGSETIERAIASIRQHVDEINIYDTGSTDKTLKILARLQRRHPEDGAPIYVKRGEWHNDFARARAASFKMASDDCDWLLWLDDDDEIAGAENLRRLAAGAEQQNLDGLVFFYDYARENGVCSCHLWRERLVQRSAGYVWKGSVHECLIPADGRRRVSRSSRSTSSTTSTTAPLTATRRPGTSRSCSPSGTPASSSARCRTPARSRTSAPSS